MRHTPPGGRGLRHYSEGTGELQSQPVEEERRDREELDMTNGRKRNYMYMYLRNIKHYI